MIDVTNGQGRVPEAREEFLIMERWSLVHAPSGCVLTTVETTSPPELGPRAIQLGIVVVPDEGWEAVNERLRCRLRVRDRLRQLVQLQTATPCWK